MLRFGGKGLGFQALRFLGLRVVVFQAKGFGV